MLVRALVGSGMLRPMVSGLVGDVAVELAPLAVTIVAEVGGSFEFTYSFDVENTGDALATNVVATVTLDPALTYVSGTGDGWGFSALAGVVTCTRAAIGAGVTRSFALHVSMTSGLASLTTTIAVEADNDDPFTEGEALTMTAEDELSGDMNGSAVISAVEFDYTVSVENTGSTDATDVIATVTLGAGLEYVSGTGTGWSVSEDAGVVTCTRALLEPGAAPDITITVETAGAASTEVTTADATGTGAIAADTASATTLVKLVDRDATSGKRLPSSLQQIADLFNYAGISSTYLPSHGYLFTEPSGSFVDFIGGKNLAVTGTPTRGKAITGWTKTAVGASGAAANQSAENATVGNVNAVSVLTVGILEIDQPTTIHQRMCHGGPSNVALEGNTNSPNVRIRTGANAANGAVSHVGAAHIFGIQHTVNAIPVDGNVNRCLTDLSLVTTTYAAAASGATLRATFGASADVAADTNFLYMLDWEGAAAEIPKAVIKTIYQALGWTVTAW